MAINRSQKLRYKRMRNHLRHVLAGAEMFDAKSRRKILTRTESLFTEIRHAFKWQQWREKPTRAKREARQ